MADMQEQIERTHFAPTTSDNDALQKAKKPL